MDPDVVNAVAGIAALVNSLILVPSIIALRKIATSHEGRITSLEVTVARPVVKVRRKRARAR